MFWKFNLITTSHVETLLNKENVTLKELMDEEDILQECKSQTKKLIDFLTQPEIMDELVTLITQEPSDELEEKCRYKYPNVACELLTSEVGLINDALAGSEPLLNKLYSFIESEKPLNPLLASFFSKTVSVLVNKKTEQTFEFLKSKDDFLSLILNHIETSAVMDLLLRVITCSENNDTHSAIVKWMHEQQLVKRLVSLIDPAHSEEQNGNAAHALSDLIKVSRDYMSLQQEKAELDPLLDAIESSAVISELLDHMLTNEKRESVLVSGILVILSLLEFKRHGPAGQFPQSQVHNPPDIQAESSPQSFTSLLFRNDGAEQMTDLDSERLNNGVSGVVTAVTPRLADFTKLLVDPPVKPKFSTTVGVLEQPLGWTRLEIAHLLSALINTNNHLVNTQLTNLGTVNILLDLFFKYSWNNFLHTQVEQLTGTIIRNTPTCDVEENKVHPLLEQLFTQGKIIQRLLDAWEENEQEQLKPGKHRKGYMGHLIKIANHISTCAENGTNSELIKLKIKELPEDYQTQWEKFVTETLTDVNKKQQSPLVVVPVTNNSLDGDCVDFRDLPYSQEAALQQAFSDYQMQQMTNNFVDQFGFNDEDFLDSDDSISGQLDRLAKVNFQFVPENNVRTSELFEQTCRDRNNPLGDVDSDEDVWEDKEQEITFASGLTLERRLTTQTNSGDNSSDSDEEIQKPTFAMASSSPIPTPHAMDEIKMDVDQADPWNASFPPPAEVPTVAMDTTNPWDSGQAGDGSGDQSWADFSSFSPFSSNEFSVPSAITLESPVLKDGSNTLEESNGTLPSTPLSTFQSKEISSTKLFSESPPKPESVTSPPQEETAIEVPASISSSPPPPPQLQNIIKSVPLPEATPCIRDTTEEVKKENCMDQQQVVVSPDIAVESSPPAISQPPQPTQQNHVQNGPV